MAAPATPAIDARPAPGSRTASTPTSRPSATGATATRARTTARTPPRPSASTRRRCTRRSPRPSMGGSSWPSCRSTASSTSSVSPLRSAVAARSWPTLRQRNGRPAPSSAGSARSARRRSPGRRRRGRARRSTGRSSRPAGAVSRSSSHRADLVRLANAKGGRRSPAVHGDARRGDHRRATRLAGCILAPPGKHP